VSLNVKRDPNYYYSLLRGREMRYLAQEIAKTATDDKLATELS